MKSVIGKRDVFFAFSIPRDDIVLFQKFQSRLEFDLIERAWPHGTASLLYCISRHGLVRPSDRGSIVTTVSAIPNENIPRKLRRMILNRQDESGCREQLYSGSLPTTSTTWPFPYHAPAKALHGTNPHSGSHPSGHRTSRSGRYHPRLTSSLGAQDATLGTETMPCDAKACRAYPPSV